MSVLFTGFVSAAGLRVQFPGRQPPGPRLRCAEGVQGLGAQEQERPRLPCPLLPQTHPQFYMVHDGQSFLSITCLLVDCVFLFVLYCVFLGG